LDIGKSTTLSESDAVDPERIETLPPTLGPSTATPLGSEYLLEQVIGSGATGRVWQGRRRGDGTPVAVKVLRGEFAEDPIAVTRFLRQRTVLKGLDHPHLVPVRDVVAEGDVLAIVMDLVDGEDLRGVLKAGTLHPGQYLAVLGQAAGALAAVHAAGVTHRDVKPENILVDRRGVEPHALLTDFGLAGIADAATLTRMSQVLGTPAYIAPETVSGRPVGPPADVYAIGVTLYEALAGRRPFVASNPHALMRAHIEDEPERPPALTGDVWDLVRSCLAKDPAARPDARAVADRALDLARRSSALPDPVPPPPPPPSPPPPPEPVAAPAPAPPPVPVPNPVPVAKTQADAPSEEAQATTGATRPAPPEPPPPAPRKKSRLPLIAAIGVCALIGTGAGVWTQQSRDEAPPASGPSSAPSKPSVSPHNYYLPVTATSPGPGAVQLRFSDGSALPGFSGYLIYRDQTFIRQTEPGAEPAAVVKLVDPSARHCWSVAALLMTDRPPPLPKPKPSCLVANGRAQTP
jgi:serine/threonine-protein kinase